MDAEVEIMRQVRDEARDLARSTQLPEQLPVTQQEIFAARARILTSYLADTVENYIAKLVQASRQPRLYSAQLAQWIHYGASPRASLALDRCSRALAWLEGRDYVTPEDVQQLAHEALRHRILLTYRAEADGVTVDDVVTELLERVPVA